MESVFSDAELTTLIDTMKIYNYFSAGDISTLIEKLLHINPQSSLKLKSRAAAAPGTFLHLASDKSSRRIFAL